MICGWEGERESVDRRRALAARLLRRGGAARLGEAPGRAWERGRYEGPYLRDDAARPRLPGRDARDLAHLVAARTSSTAAVGAALGTALAAQGTPGIVMCHVSHAYRDGASLYFTFVARGRPGEEIEQWRAVKTAACEAIVAAGGTITHHHAVGRDHAPYMPAEVGRDSGSRPCGR